MGRSAVVWLAVPQRRRKGLSKQSAASASASRWLLPNALAEVPEKEVTEAELIAEASWTPATRETPTGLAGWGGSLGL